MTNSINSTPIAKNIQQVESPAMEETANFGDILHNLDNNDMELTMPLNQKEETGAFDQGTDDAMDLTVSLDNQLDENKIGDDTMELTIPLDNQIAVNRAYFDRSENVSMEVGLSQISNQEVPDSYQNISEEEDMELTTSFGNIVQLLTKEKLQAFLDFTMNNDEQDGVKENMVTKSQLVEKVKKRLSVGNVQKRRMSLAALKTMVHFNGIL